MKRAELLTHAKCDLCRAPIGNSGLPLFWCLTIERHGIDIPAVKRSDGFVAFVGNAAIAGALSDDPELTKPVMDPIKLTACEGCAIGARHSLAEMTAFRD